MRVLEPVMPRVKTGVLQAKRARQIDDADAAVHDPRRELGGRLVRQRQEDDVDIAGEHLFGERLDVAGPHVGKGRQPTSGGGRARRHRRGDCHGRMSREQPQELLARIAGRARNNDLRFSSRPD